MRAHIIVHSSNYFKLIYKYKFWLYIIDTSFHDNKLFNFFQRNCCGHFMQNYFI